MTIIIIAHVFINNNYVKSKHLYFKVKSSKCHRPEKRKKKKEEKGV